MPEPLNLEPFRELAARSQHLAREATRLHAPDVDVILRTGNRDCPRIEHLLDGMLDFCFDADMLLLFKKLCRYYYRIDPAATVNYVRAYREMWDDEREAADD